MSDKIKLTQDQFNELYTITDEPTETPNNTEPIEDVMEPNNSKTIYEDDTNTVTMEIIDQQMEDEFYGN